MKETQHTEPCYPDDYLIHCLYIHYSKNKDKFVEQKIPKLIL
jgi:hypothetical protein